MSLTTPGLLLAFLLSSPSPATPTRPLLTAMLAEKDTAMTNEATVRRLYRDVFNAGDFAALSEIVTPDFVPNGGGTARGPQTVREGLLALRTAFPDLHARVEDLVVDGDLVAVRNTVTGTNTGTLFGQPPTGRSATWTSMNIFALRGGRLAQTWSVDDQLAVFTQLGIIPPSGPPAPAPARSSIPHDPSSDPVHNAAATRRWFGVGWAGHPEVADDTFDSSFVLNGVQVGPEGPKRSIRENLSAFSNSTVRVEQLLASGDRVVTHWSVEATHTAPLGTIPAAGRTVRFDGIVFWRFANGKVVEDVTVSDTFGLLQQLGVVPSSTTPAPR